MMDRLPDGTSTPGEPEPHDPLVGRLLDGRYRIVSLIAAGGMGRVYKGEQASLGRTVAIKVLTPTGLTGLHDPGFKERFAREAATTSRLSHPNTVTTFDFGRTDDDIYYIVMEYVEGITLSRRLRAEHRFDARKALAIARQVCRSLREAHAQYIIHRDLKPSNILLTYQGDDEERVKVLDFGVAKIMTSDPAREDDDKLTRAGTFVGTPEYAAPEAVYGRADLRSDIYSVGVLIYRMLTGRVPFRGPTETVSLLMVVNDPVPPIDPALGVSRRVEQLVMRCLEKEPDRRFQSMDELVRAIDACLIELGAEPPSLLTPSIAGAIPNFPLKEGVVSLLSPSMVAPLGGTSGPPTGDDRQTVAEPFFAAGETGSAPSLARSLARPDGCSTSGPDSRFEPGTDRMQSGSRSAPPEEGGSGGARLVAGPGTAASTPGPDVAGGLPAPGGDRTSVSGTSRISSVSGAASPLTTPPPGPPGQEMIDGTRSPAPPLPLAGGYGLRAWLWAGVSLVLVVGVGGVMLWSLQSTPPRPDAALSPAPGAPAPKPDPVPGMIRAAPGLEPAPQAGAVADQAAAPAPGSIRALPAPGPASMQAGPGSSAAQPGGAVGAADPASTSATTSSPPDAPPPDVAGAAALTGASGSPGARSDRSEDVRRAEQTQAASGPVRPESGAGAPAAAERPPSAPVVERPASVPPVSRKTRARSERSSAPDSPAGAPAGAAPGAQPARSSPGDPVPEGYKPSPY